MTTRSPRETKEATTHTCEKQRTRQRTVFFANFLFAPPPKMSSSVPVLNPSPISAQTVDLAVKTMESLPKKRADGVPLTAKELIAVTDLLQSYITTPSRKAPPSKALL